MIDIHDIYDRTNGGLDIILSYYPQAASAVDNKKHFKMRLDERTPSAVLSRHNNVYYVTDFGGDGRALSPADICMREEHLNFNEAVLILAERYGVKDELNHSVNKPHIEQVASKPDQKDGDKFFEFKSSFSASELKVLGPRVKQENCDDLNWHSAKFIAYVKNGKVTYKYSTDTYPIFIRKCIVEEETSSSPAVEFYKSYEPLNPEKQWRFSYMPDGVKPPKYVNGLYELKKKYYAYNKEEERAFKQDPANEDKPYVYKKLPEAFICSGERDSLCVRALGFFPLWFNSETYKLSEDEYREIMHYVETLYNIPDIDTTGKRKGTELALSFLDIYTIWLPDNLSSFKDNRGKPRKDLRDFVGLYNTKKSFTDLMTLAKPARFWSEKVNKKTGAKSYDIDTYCLMYFLTLNGFYTLKDDKTSSTVFVRVEGNIVRQIKARDIKFFLLSWAEKRFMPREIHNLIYNSQRLSESMLETLRPVNLDFTSCSSDMQLFFFENCTLEVKGDGVIEHPPGSLSLDRYVWKDNLIKHKIKVAPDMFKVTISDDFDNPHPYDISILNLSSNFFKYLINSSRLYWREELEYNDGSIYNKDAYNEDYKFSINGPLLSYEKIMEQKQNLINKIFTIGYMLHRFKSPSRAWAPQAMDNRIGEDGECNGRSGKSFMFKTLSLFLKSVKLSGRNPKLMENPHVFDQVTRHTELVLVDDCDRYLNMGAFYDNITSDMTVNPKNNQSYSIPFEESPKFAFTTNYVPLNFDPSTEARLLYVVFSDYYHERTEENDYKESRSIRDDFGKDLFSNLYSEGEWQADINFLLQCTRFYLFCIRRCIKILPPMQNIIKRKFKADMGANFEDWAFTYFAESGEHLDVLIPRADAYEDYKKFSGLNKTTMNRFTKALKSFCELCPYISCLNPEHLKNGQGRIIRKFNDISVEMIYVQTYNPKEKNDLPPL